MERKDLILLCGVGAAVYYLTKSSNQKEIDDMRKRINELNDNVLSLDDQFHEDEYKNNIFNFVKPTQFVGIVGDWKNTGDTQVSYRWWVKFENNTSKDYQININNVDVTLFGQAQLKRTACKMSYTIPSHDTVWLMTSVGSGRKVYPKNTIKPNISSTGEIKKTNIACAVSYNISGAYVNTGVPTEKNVVVLKGTEKVAVLFTGVIGAGSNGLEQLKDDNLIPKGAKVFAFKVDDSKYD